MNLNLPPEKCIRIEDSEVRIEAILAAKMYAIGIGDPAILHRAHIVYAVLGISGSTDYNGPENRITLRILDSLGFSYDTLSAYSMDNQLNMQERGAMYGYRNTPEVDRRARFLQHS